LLGPQSPEDFILPEESGQKNPTEERDQELWQMLSLFTLPDHRGRGLGKKLCQEALSYLASYKDSPRELWVRLMVKPENHATVSLYRGLGFGESGKCTLAEALVANGDKDLLPDSISGKKYTSRSGLIMMLEIHRS
jgi:GNAT superfamily N-acetyltransferase